MTTQLPLPAELPTTATTMVSDYPTYAAAQQAVDYLSDHGFPVATTRGRRDFASHRRLAAASYHLTLGTDHADEANRLLVQQIWRTL